jgi:hypothetical protein
MAAAAAAAFFNSPLAVCHLLYIISKNGGGMKVHELFLFCFLLSAELQNVLENPPFFQDTKKPLRE